MKTPMNSIKNFLNLSYFVLILVFILLTGLLIGLSINRIIQSNIQQQNINLAHSVEKNIELFLNETENNIKLLRDNLSNIIGFNDQRNINNYLASFLQNYSQVEKVRLLDEKGRVEYVQPHTPEEIGIDLSQEKFMKNLEKGKIVWSDSFLSPISGEPAITATMPLEEYFLVVNIDISYFNQMLSDMRKDSHIITYDEEGTAIASTTPEHVYHRDNHRNLAHVKGALAGREVTHRFICGVHNKEMLGSSTPLKNNWVITASEPVDTAYETVYKIFRILGLTGILLLLMGYIISHIFTKKLTDPIVKLTESSRELAGGNYAKVQARSGFRELKTLANSFNQMTDRIKTREEELRHKQKELKVSYSQLMAFTQEVTAMNEELDQSFSQIKKLNKRFVSMIELISSLGHFSEMEEEVFLSNILDKAVEIVPEADYGLVCLVEGDECHFVGTVGHNASHFNNLRIDKAVVFSDKIPQSNVDSNYLFNLKKLKAEEKKLFLKALKPVEDSIFIDIKINSEVTGRIYLDIARGSEREFSKTTEKLLSSFAILASAFFSFQRYNKLQGEFTRELITSIIQILEIYDTYTSGHSENVAEMAANLAEKMGLSDQQIKDTYWAGMVHDIGKLLVPLEVLNKKGSLTDAEFDLIENHPYWGYMALSKSKSLEHIAEYVLYHHERWDGTGYPEGIKGEEIPLISRILGVADAWDAMTSRRAYREPLSREKAREELQEGKGSQFDPAVVEAFMRL